MDRAEFFLGDLKKQQQTHDSSNYFYIIKVLYAFTIIWSESFIQRRGGVHLWKLAGFSQTVEKNTRDRTNTFHVEFQNSFFFNTVRRRAHTHNVGGFHHEYYYSLVLVVVPTTTLVSIKSRVCVCLNQQIGRRKAPMSDFHPAF